MKLRNLRTSDEVLADELRDPAFRAEWERTSVARALAKRVSAFRVENHLSQRELAAKLGTSQTQVARLEAGHNNPTIETLSRVANLLGAQIDLRVPAHYGEPTLTTRSRSSRAVAVRRTTTAG